MTPRQFARAVAAEKDQLLRGYFAARSGYAVAQRIASMKLSPAQRRQLRKVMNEALTDFGYTLLLALDGAASIGGLQQQEYHLADENGKRLTGGELEGEAYEAFHGRK